VKGKYKAAVGLRGVHAVIVAAGRKLVFAKSSGGEAVRKESGSERRELVRWELATPEEMTPGQVTSLHETLQSGEPLQEKVSVN